MTHLSHSDVDSDLIYCCDFLQVQRAIKVAAAGRKRSKAARKAAQEEAAADGTQRKARPMPKGVPQNLPPN